MHVDRCINYIMIMTKIFNDAFNIQDKLLFACIFIYPQRFVVFPTMIFLWSLV